MATPNFDRGSKLRDGCQPKSKQDCTLVWQVYIAVSHFKQEL